MADEKEWRCVNCDLEFRDPHDPKANENVTVVSVRGTIALVLQDGKPHSLRKKTTEHHARRRAAESQGFARPQTLYLREWREEKEESSENAEMTEDKGTGK